MRKPFAFWLVVCWIATVIPAASGTLPGPLVSVDWLNANLNNSDLVVLDIRSPRKSRNFYNEGHIEGAISAPYNDGWRETIDGVVGMLPPVETISKHIGSLGVDNDTQVVIVPFGRSSTDFSAATRVYWTFKVLGHETVSILEGGFNAWLATGKDVSTKNVIAEAKVFKPRFRPDLLASEQDVHQLKFKDNLLLDARPFAQYSGRVASPVVKRAGTIPGAKNLRQSVLYDGKKGQFLQRSGIEAALVKAGIDDADGKITFCNTGHWASIVWFALSEIKGIKNVSLYDGSMAEWTLDVNNPVR